MEEIGECSLCYDRDIPIYRSIWKTGLCDECSMLFWREAEGQQKHRDRAVERAPETKEYEQWLNSVTW